MTAHPAGQQTHSSSTSTYVPPGVVAKATNLLAGQGRNGNGPAGVIENDQQKGLTMHFNSRKVIVVGGSAGMGRQVAVDIARHGGSAVIVGRSKERVDDTVTELTGGDGQAWGSLPS
jgi:shikimate 5-dehydrogenase